ncbi:hypothetical protein [Umezakia ovalisporum]|uniref:Uncharacterized protein n=2 Tax=Umezakia ovalisporum TaxID=75695 RepID=A0AA43H169_9CYAN|nr:hypothetical protein [Umezakia ovalisporum]MDH6057816.1 hypothetical protein [Umezakia ovalisporum FSS-43]MDH6064848.1 hypothetical protein [Umezakia ovalisporum FSS-62]MDH6067448.1 hypothetical protein [Umezakia ovalisporum APH033B]MDH6070403.1 hypothetical protein [Umezakia ovalisporum CobakiLakeA]MDH6074579.1 hypothetical protein [Umezakia ovalisporum CS-1034]
MSITTVKTCRLRKSIYTKIQRLCSNTVLLLSLWSCSTTTFSITHVTWNTYNNSRYGFQFPYPSNWNPLPSTANNDGIVLVSPRNNSVEIRAWAGNRLPESIRQNSKTTINPNFHTAQGVPGVLLVESDQQITSMKLSLTQDQVEYHWQARSQNQQFSDYYHLFYYIAHQYQIRR